MGSKPDAKRGQHNLAHAELADEHRVSDTEKAHQREIRFTTKSSTFETAMILNCRRRAVAGAERAWRT
jgi:hypothetical protein